MVSWWFHVHFGDVPSINLSTTGNLLVFRLHILDSIYPAPRQAPEGTLAPEAKNIRQILIPRNSFRKKWVNELWEAIWNISKFVSVSWAYLPGTLICHFYMIRSNAGASPSAWSIRAIFGMACTSVPWMQGTGELPLTLRVDVELEFGCVVSWSSNIIKPDSIWFWQVKTRDSNELISALPSLDFLTLDVKKLHSVIEL